MHWFVTNKMLEKTRTVSGGQDPRSKTRMTTYCKICVHSPRSQLLFALTSNQNLNTATAIFWLLEQQLEESFATVHKRNIEDWKIENIKGGVEAKIFCCCFKPLKILFSSGRSGRAGYGPG